jgi:hypothetical protein
MKSDLYTLVLGDAPLRCNILVLATFGSDFTLHLNTNETPHLLL